MPTYTLIASGLQRTANGQFSSSTTDFPIIFDAVTDISYIFSSSPTAHPVDDKSSITDHVIQNNDTFTITGSVSNSPVQIFAGNTFEYGPGRNRSSDALNKLKQFKESAEVIILSTDFGTISSCIIKRISGRLTADTKNAYLITLELEKITLVSAQEVRLLTVASDGLADDLSGNASGGSKDKATYNLPEGKKTITHFENVTGIPATNLIQQGLDIVL